MKLKEKTTLIIGTLAGILSGYQKEKVEQEYIRKQLKKTLRKYWQLAGNVEIVYGVMDHISWKLLAQTLESPLYEEMMSLYKEDGLSDEQKARRQELIEMAQAKLAESLEVEGYNNKVDTHREYILKLNVLGVDVKLTTEILNERIDMVEAYIDLLQSAIDSFAGAKDSAVVGKFNARLKNFTKRLLNIVDYINDNYPEEEFELNASEDKNSFTNPIFNEDIITSDEGDTTKRFYTDFANADGELIPDGQIDKNDVIILKAIIKNLDNLSKEDKEALVKAIDTNGDGFLNSDDTDWLANYVQDQAEINSQRENGEYTPYSEHNLSDETRQLITNIVNGNYKTDNPDTPEAPATQTTPSSSSYLYNNSEVNGDNGGETTTDNNGETTDNNGEATDNGGETIDNGGETTDNTGETIDNNGETPDVNVGD